MNNHSDLTGSINRQLSKKEQEWISEKWWHGLKLIKPCSDILDIGCADASFFDFLKNNISTAANVNNNHNNNHNFTGTLSCFDVDKKALLAAKAKGYSTFSSLSSIKQKFDVITLWEIIEHIPVQKFIAYLDFAKYHLKEDGMLIISTPNILNLFYPFWAEPTHIRPYCLESLCNILESQGFLIMHKKETHALRHPLKILVCKLLGINMYAKVIVACKIK